MSTRLVVSVQALLEVVLKDLAGRDFTNADRVSWLKRLEAVASFLQLQTFDPVARHAPADDSNRLRFT